MRTRRGVHSTRPAELVRCNHPLAHGVLQPYPLGPSIMLRSTFRHHEQGFVSASAVESTRFVMQGTVISLVQPC